MSLPSYRISLIPFGPGKALQVTLQSFLPSVCCFGTTGHRKEVFAPYLTVNTPPYGSPWQQVFVHAMLEMDSPRVPEKIAAAEHAISKRLTELPVSQANAAELEALISAISKISRLKRSA